MKKYPNIAAVDVSKCPVTKGRKGQKQSRTLAEKPIRVAHKHSTSGEDGEAMHWIRSFRFEGGPVYVHGPTYHTLNRRGNVAYGQYASMLPSEEFGALIGDAIESGIIVLPPRTLEFLRQKSVPE